MNYFAIGFGVIALTAVGAVDYTNQASAAGQAPGQFSLGAYIASYGARFGAVRDARALAERQSVSAKTHLPDAPEGWERRAFEPDVRIDFQFEGVRPDPSATDFLSTQQMQALQGQAAKTAREETWEYVRGDEVVRLSARYDAPKDGVTGPGAGDMARFTKGTVGFDTMQGVPWFAASDAGSDGKIAHYSLRTRMGGAITLRVEAMATDASVRALLDMIDYDALDAMLDPPLAGVGRSAPTLSDDAGRAAAQAAIDAYQSGRDVAAGSLVAEAGAPDIAAPKDTTVPTRVQLQSRSKPKGTAAKPAKRLKLSGGASCLGGSGGHFCRD